MNYEMAQPNHTSTDAIKTQEDYSCEYCEKVYDNNVELLLCYAAHFEEELTGLVRQMMSPEQMAALSCPVCGDPETEFEDLQSLSRHIGGIHLLVNDLLIREGIFPRIPTSEEFDLYFDKN